MFIDSVTFIFVYRGLVTSYVDVTIYFCCFFVVLIKFCFSNWSVSLFPFSLFFLSLSFSFSNFNFQIKIKKIYLNSI